MEMVVPRIGEILRDMGILTERCVEEILEQQKRTARRFGQIALAWGLATPEQIWTAWSRQLTEQHHHVDLDDVGIDTNAVTRVSSVLARFYRIVPLRLWGDNLVVAAPDNAEHGNLEDLPSMLGCRIYQCYCDPAQVDEYIRRLYGLAAA
jgi:type IV pilus assembly protein PilB